MKPQTRTKKLPMAVPDAAEAELCLPFQNELVATIQGAFEVAVEIAVLEVTKLVSQAMGDVRDQMHETQRENDTLKQRLQNAEEKLHALRLCMGELDGAAKQRSPTTRTSLPSGPDEGLAARSPGEHKEEPATQNVAHSLGEEGLEEHSGGTFSEICVDGRVFPQTFSSSTSRQSLAHEDQTDESDKEGSSLGLAKVEDVSNQSQDDPFQPSDIPLPPGGVEGSIPDQVRIKMEDAVDGASGPDCRFNSMMEESFGADSLSLAQSKMLDEWKPELLDMPNQTSDPLVPGTSLSLAHPPSINPDLPELNVPSSSGLPSFSSQFPNLFQPGEPAPPQVYGVQVRSNHNSVHPPIGLHTCKICGQAFHQPSLLRRHYGQCQQRLQQRCRPPPIGTRRTKLQLYPPGCSPFHCTECNRDFNRLENLKTHLRIHTGERPYTCSVCSMRFRHSGALTRHFRIHTGEKPYVCGQCGKTFRNCGGLKFHQRSHNRQ